jgi:N-acetylglucosaminyldiphosphoundecaprenol N-acetyl-beta-D-mannosaminyltransferase
MHPFRVPIRTLGGHLTLATEALVVRGNAPLPELSLTSGLPFHVLRPRVDLGGVLVDQVDLPGAVEKVGAFLSTGRAHQIVTVNTDFLSIARQNMDFRKTLNDADLAVADGMPLVWLSRLKGTPLPQRVAGVELFTESCRLAAQSGHSVFLLGAGPGVAARAATVLQERFAGLRIAGTYTPSNGLLSRRENERMIRVVQRAAPDFLFVALGAPRQDQWIRENLQRLHVPVSMGVGCVFDLLAGGVNRAPSWMQRSGLEWAFRLGQEPGRLWRRYLLNDLPTLGHLLLDSLVEDREPGLAVTT